MSTFDSHKPHDLGGRDAGAVDTGSHDKLPWEKRVDALTRLLADDKRRLIRTDEMRRAIEGLGDDAYTRLDYYERWMAATVELLLEKQVITVDELGERMAAIEAAQAQKLA